MKDFEFEVLPGNRLRIKIPINEVDYRIGSLERSFHATTTQGNRVNGMAELYLSGAEDFDAMVRYVRGTPGAKEVLSPTPAT